MSIISKQDKFKPNLSKGALAIDANDSILLESGQSITYTQLLVLLSAALTVAAEWGSITGNLEDQTDLYDTLTGLQANLDSLLMAGYITTDAVAESYVPYSGATTDINIGETINLIGKILKAVNSSGLCIKNSSGDMIVEFGNGGRSTTVYGHITPDTNASRDLGNIITALKTFQNAYITRSIIINPSVGVSAVSMLDIISDSPSKICQILKARTSQTADLVQYRDSADAPMSKISAKGLFVSGGSKRVTSDFTKTSDTTLSTVTGLSVDVEAGKTYKFRAKLFVNTPASGGQKVTIGGTCTATHIYFEGFAPNSNYGIANSLGTLVVILSSALSTSIVVEGTITVNVAGTLDVKFAQNVSNATASRVYRGSTFIVEEMN